MSSTTCRYPNRDEAIVAYVYDELGAEEHHRFARHVGGCLDCREEVAQFAGVRTQLAAWTPPALESLLGDRSRRRLDDEVPAAARTSGWWAIPVWAQVAAAMLCLGIGTGVGAGLADLRVSYGSQGLTIATGRGTARDAVTPAATGVAAIAATRADLSALEQQLRSEIAANRSLAERAAQAADQPAGDEVMRRARALVRDSEQRQQRELALRVAEVAREVQAQRQADLVRIDRTLGVLQNNTGMAVRRQEQLLNSLAVRVSQRQ
jgi:putative zinc finger protein